MQLTSRHLDYWRERKLRPSWMALIPPRPKWLEPSPMPRVSIDTIVNLNAGIKFTNHENTIPLLRLARQNGDLVPCMKRCALSAQHKRRAAWCRKWLRRLGHTT